MKTFRSSSGQFRERPYFTDREVDDLCEDALRKTDLMPSHPEPIRIDRFIEKRFGVSPAFDEMPKGIAGFTCFSETGVASVHVSRTLVEEGTLTADRRISSTLAHEAGHCLLHAHLFVFQQDNSLLFKSDPNVQPMQVMCRESEPNLHAGYNGGWWELQANMAIGALLIPASLVEPVVSPFLIEKGLLGTRLMDPSKKAEAILELSRAFSVNLPVARFRLQRLFPEEGRQRCL